MTEQGQCMLKHTVHRSCQLYVESISKDLQNACVLQISTTVGEWVSMTKELHPSLTSPSGMQSVRCRGVMS
ncbi:unnamed protein product, partial [Staurois parvus]